MNKRRQRWLVYPVILRAEVASASCVQSAKPRSSVRACTGCTCCAMWLLASRSCSLAAACMPAAAACCPPATASLRTNMEICAVSSSSSACLSPGSSAQRLECTPDQQPNDACLSITAYRLLRACVRWDQDATGLVVSARYRHSTHKTAHLFLRGKGKVVLVKFKTRILTKTLFLNLCSR